MIEYNKGIFQFAFNKLKLISNYLTLCLKIFVKKLRFIYTSHLAMF